MLSNIRFATKLIAAHGKTQRASETGPPLAARWQRHLYDRATQDRFWHDPGLASCRAPVLSRESERLSAPSKPQGPACCLSEDLAAYVTFGSSPGIHASPRHSATSEVVPTRCCSTPDRQSRRRFGDIPRCGDTVGQFCKPIDTIRSGGSLILSLKRRD